MQKIIAIAHNTFKEAIRDRILYGFLFFAFFILMFSLVLGQLSVDQELRTTVDIGLAGISFFSVLISIFIGINLLNKEIQKRTIYPVLSKPVTRATYLVGKFMGLVWVVGFLMLLMLGLFFVLVIYQGGTINIGLLMAVALIFCETILVISIALFFTSFSSPFLSGLLCFGIFVSGRNAHFISELGNQKGLEAFAPLFDGVSAVLPNFYLFYPSGKVVDGTFATVHDQFISSGYFFGSMSYGLVYTLFFLTVSILILNKREFV